MKKLVRINVIALVEVHEKVNVGDWFTPSVEQEFLEHLCKIIREVECTISNIGQRGNARAEVIEVEIEENPEE